MPPSVTTQDDRLLSITTPLGKDFLLINRLTANEGLSQLFSYEVELLHEENDPGYTPTPVDVKSLLGQGVVISIEQRDKTKRTFTGIINHFSQGNRNVRFSYYYATIVPHVWILTQNMQNAIFQNMTVPDILKKIFKGFDVSYQLQGTYNPRNYCVQYRESDFGFASRLMEEEGIFYFFEHSEDRHKMVIADTPQSHLDCPSKSSIPFGLKVPSDKDFITSIKRWQTDHKLQTGKITSWDYNFQLPTNKLDAVQPSLFTVADNQKMEIYDYPGGYARKYDGIAAGGGENVGDLQNVFPDKTKTAKNMMESLDAQYKTASGISDCSSMTAGYRFTFFNHPTNNVNGKYVITSITHETEQNPTYVTDDIIEQPYSNNFTCIAFGEGQPGFRPPRKTPKPIIQGSQTAVVVGRSGDEIFTDKYGRVKVQFHWDRDGQVNESSSCWVRVAQLWAGNKWGAMFIPRVGMECIVHFLEGDPDQPIITGCVYNPQTMPPYTLPDEKTKSTIKSDSSTGGGGFNEFRIEDKKGDEQIFFHAQKDMDIRVRSDRRELIGNDRHLIVNRDKRDRIKRDEHRIIERDQIEKIERDFHRHVEGDMAAQTDGDLSHAVGGNIAESVGGSHTEDVGKTIYLKAGMKVIVEAGTQITLKVGGNFVDIGPAGVTIVGTMVNINSGGAAGSATAGNGVSPMDPEEAEIADNADPGSKSPTYKNQRRQLPSWKKPTFIKPWHRPKSPTNKDKKSWIEILLCDEDDNPVAGERYRITLPDGSTIAEGTTNSKGFAKVTNIDPGNCKITFPRLDGRSWDKK